MNAQQDKAKSIFVNAVEIASAPARQAYIDEACGGDEALRHEILDFLEHYDQVGAFLEAPVPGRAATLDEPVSERPGSIIGPYKLLEQIGEGGFGVVFMAEQQHPVRRKVALKVLKPGMDTRQVIARFEAERQALALMDHPNIARVFDGGESCTSASPSPRRISLGEGGRLRSGGRFRSVLMRAMAICRSSSSVRRRSRSRPISTSAWSTSC